jgi:UDP:flavonoid glycosyltransferase YjiC (YdhE family)
MSFGIPIVAAGLTEDKANVNARIAWSGVGINLATNEPTPLALNEAVRTVLATPTYRSHATAMAGEFARVDTRTEMFRIISETAHKVAFEAVLVAQCPTPDKIINPDLQSKR